MKKSTGAVHMDLWFTEYHRDGAGITIKVKETLFLERSAYQEIAIVDTYEFGKMLVIDGLVMLTEADEFIYHEMMAHPALVLHPMPKDVLIIGGGDGGTAREVLRHQRVERLTLCEIDKMVIEACQRYLPALSMDILEDQRGTILIEDAIEYVKSMTDRFDVILVDSSDPVGPAQGLFSQEFFTDLRSALKKDGIVSIQSESPFYHSDIITQIKEGLERAGFEHVHFYWAHIPTYPGGVWCWAMASNVYHPVKDLNGDVIKKEPHLLSGSLLRYYDLEVHVAAFTLPRYMKEYLKRCGRKA